MEQRPTFTVANADELLIGNGRTQLFVGRDHGAGISYFFIDANPGDHPGLHRHPYSETWIVLEGTATITAGDLHVIARAGQTLTVPPNTWHEFVAIGSQRLKMVCIHASPEVIQEFLNPEDEP